MFGNQFYNQTTRRYVAIFGTLFNDITIDRRDANGTVVQAMKVPLNYGPMERFLARIQQDPDLTSPAIRLPRMSFEMTSMVYDPERKLTPMTYSVKGIANNDSAVKSQFTPAPYDLEFQLNIMVKYAEDGTKIIEQILPFFKPEFTVTANLVDGMDALVDIPIVLNSINVEDTYEGSYEDRRAIIWTLNFTLKGYYYGPVSQRKIIKFANTNVYSTMTAEDPISRITVQPGLTANGQPTTDINQTVAYSAINIDDDWAYIVQIVDPNE